jgi:pimeloyl-ACP methyl ester carboxylesterase
VDPARIDIVRLADAPPVDFPAALRGHFASAAYTLSDLAADTVGLMDALGFDSAHLVGASMGGSIAQLAAIEHPARVRSLTLLIPTTGSKAVGQPDPAVLPQLFAGGPATTRGSGRCGPRGSWGRPDTRRRRR